MSDQNLAKFLCKKFNLPGAIVLISKADTTIELNSHDVNHARANEMLSVGIYINLDQHYAAVINGDAGPDAAKIEKQCRGEQ